MTGGALNLRHMALRTCIRTKLQTHPADAGAEMTSTSSHLSNAIAKRRASDPDPSRAPSDTALARTTRLRWFNVPAGRDATSPSFASRGRTPQ